MVGLESSTAAVAAVAAAAAAASQLATIKDAAQRSTLAHCPQVPHACFSLAEDNGAPGGGLPQPVQAPGAIVCCALHSACRSSVSRLSSAHLKQGCKALLWGSLCAIAQCTVRRKACASSWHARRLLDACRAATKPAAACCIAHSSTAPLPLPLLAWDIGSLVHHSLQPQRITAGFV